MGYLFQLENGEIWLLRSTGLLTGASIAQCCAYAVSLIASYLSRGMDYSGRREIRDI